MKRHLILLKRVIDVDVCGSLITEFSIITYSTSDNTTPTTM